MIGIEKPYRVLPSPCISNRSVMDISIDEDIDKMPVEVLINLFLPQGFTFKHFTPVAPFCGKKQKQWFFTVRIFFLKVQASNPGIRLSIDHVDRLTHC